MKKQNFSIRLLILAGVFLVFASSCEDADNKGKQNVPVLSITEVTEITPTTATSTGNITDDGGATVTARGVCWSKNENPTIDENKTEDGTGVGSFTSSITNLESNTTYYVRAYATNSAGIGYSDGTSFTTEESVSLGSFADSRDGKVYKTVTIGTQVWMAENLAYLPSVVGPGTGAVTMPFYYVYGYNGTSVSEAKATTNYSTYGVIYNWEAAMAACPAGWHVPSDAEWTQLTTYLGGESIAGGKLKESGTSRWTSPNTGATNETGFAALPGGWRYYTLERSFEYMGSQGYWWSATEITNNFAWSRFITNDGSTIVRHSGNEEFGFYVRCVKD